MGQYWKKSKLVLEFGEAYIKYQHEVPMLIPLLNQRWFELMNQFYV